MNDVSIFKTIITRFEYMLQCNQIISEKVIVVVFCTQKCCFPVWILSVLSGGMIPIFLFEKMNYSCDLTRKFSIFKAALALAAAF